MVNMQLKPQTTTGKHDQQLDLSVTQREKESRGQNDCVQVIR
jgi:hypothetical protein